MALNVLYNLGIFVCLIAGYSYGIEQKNYVILALALVIVVLLIMQKIKLIKEIKNIQKPNP